MAEADSGRKESPDSSSAEGKAPCCPTTPDCGCGDAPSSCCDLGGSSTAKTVIFVLLIAAAIGVLIHGLTKDQAADTDARLQAAAFIKQIAPDQDVVFVMLTDGKTDNQQAASDQVEAATKKLIAQGKRVGRHTIQPGGSHYAELVKQHSIASFPSVITISKTCSAKAISGVIDEEKLLEAYVNVTSMPAGCGPGGCCAADG